MTLPSLKSAVLLTESGTSPKTWNEPELAQILSTEFLEDGVDRALIELYQRFGHRPNITLLQQNPGLRRRLERLLSCPFRPNWKT